MATLEGTGSTLATGFRPTGFGATVATGFGATVATGFGASVVGLGVGNSGVGSAVIVIVTVTGRDT